MKKKYNDRYSPVPPPRPGTPYQAGKKKVGLTLLKVFLGVLAVSAIVVLVYLLNTNRKAKEELERLSSHPSSTSVMTIAPEPSSTPTAEVILSSSSIQALRVGYYDAELGYSDYTLDDGGDYPLWTTESNSVSPEPILVDHVNQLEDHISIQSFGEVGVMFSIGSLSQAGMPSGNNHLYVYGGTRLDLGNEQGLTDIVLTEGAVFLKMAGEAEITQIVFPRHRNATAKLMGGSGLFVTDSESVSFWCISEDCQLEYGDALQELQQGQIRVYKPFEESLTEPENYQPPSERYEEYVLWNNKCNLCMPYEIVPEPTVQEPTAVTDVTSPTATHEEQPGRYSLTINVDGQGSVSPDGGIYDAGTRVTLTASPADGWEFTGWSTGGSSLTTTITVNDNITVTARFTKKTATTYTLTVNIEGQGRVSPNGGSYEAGTRVTLTAIPAEGWEFTKWSTGVTTVTTTVTMDSSKTITATFSKKQTAMYTLTVNIDGQGSVNPNGGSYGAGTKVTLTATPSEGWEFAKWSTGETGSTITVTMNSNITITATFRKKQPAMYTLTVNIDGQGSVGLNPPGGRYEAGTKVTLTATPATGWEFSAWSTGGTSPTTTVTMNSDIAITARFTKKPPVRYTLTVSVSGQGMVSLNPPGGTYDAGTTVTLTASAYSGWVFDRWSNGSISRTIYVTMNSNISITAYFVQSYPYPPYPRWIDVIDK